MPVLLDSITDTRAEHKDQIAIAGSHGGRYAAVVASRAGLRAVVLNDAGVGRDDAGISGVRELDSVGMVGATVSTESAEIGSGQASLDHGELSFVNAAAHQLGLRKGQKLRDIVELLEKAQKPHGLLPEIEEARWEEEIGQNTILCVDSASLVRPEDAGALIVTGSHGALLGSNPTRSTKAKARLAVFNDAGGGRNGAGFSRLAALQAQGVAGVTVSCQSARIGDATSSLNDGIISSTNELARADGLVTGMPLLRGLKNLKQL